MSYIIQDGKGTKKKAEVDSTNKLQVRSVSEPSSIEALNAGDQYIFHSHVLNITNSSFTSVLYLRNDEPSRNLIINLFEFSSKVAYDSGPAILADQGLIVLVRQNPSGPSFSDTWHNHNADFGSANQISVTALQPVSGAAGANGGSFTNSGDLIVHDIVQCGVGGQALPLEELKLRPGNSIGLQIIPPANNADLDFHFNLNCYLKD